MIGFSKQVIVPPTVHWVSLEKTEPRLTRPHSPYHASFKNSSLQLIAPSYIPHHATPHLITLLHTSPHLTTLLGEGGLNDRQAHGRVSSAALMQAMESAGRKWVEAITITAVKCRHEVCHCRKNGRQSEYQRKGPKIERQSELVRNSILRSRMLWC